MRGRCTHGCPEALAEAIKSRVEEPPGSGRARTNLEAGGGHLSCTKICASSFALYKAVPTRAPQASSEQPSATAPVTRTTLLKSARCRRGQVAAGTWRARFTMPGEAGARSSALPMVGVRMEALGRRFAQVHASCKNGTRGWWEAAPRPPREGSGADGSRPGPVGRVFLLFQVFGLWHFCLVLGLKKRLLHRNQWAKYVIWAARRHPRGCGAKLRLQIKI